jgi:hypothetical protein
MQTVLLHNNNNNNKEEEKPNKNTGMPRGAHSTTKRVTQDGVTICMRLNKFAVNLQETYTVILTTPP